MDSNRRQAMAAITRRPWWRAATSEERNLLQSAVKAETPGKRGWVERADAAARIAVSQIRKDARPYDHPRHMTKREIALSNHGLCLRIELEGCGAHGWSIVARRCRVDDSIQRRGDLVRRWLGWPRVVTRSGDEYTFSATRPASEEEVAYVKDLHGLTYAAFFVGFHGTALDEDESRLAVTRKVRELGGISLNEARALVKSEGPDCKIKGDISKEEAEDIKKQLGLLGAVVEIK